MAFANVGQREPICGFERNIPRIRELNDLMKRSIIVRLLITLVMLLVALNGSTRSAQAATFSINVVYGGCSQADGIVSYSGLLPTYAIEVNAVTPSGYIRWSGALANGSGSQIFDMGWTNPTPLADGTGIRLEIWVFDTAANAYVPGLTGVSPTTYSCTNTPAPGNIPTITYYPPDTRVLGTVNYTTPIYASPDKSSAVVGTLTAGQTWYLVGTAHNATWYQVYVSGANLVWVPAAAFTPSGPVHRGKAQPNHQ